jgi:hypothetical protein
MAERPYVAEVCRGLLRKGSQGRKKGKFTLTAIMDMGHGGRGPFLLLRRMMMRIDSLMKTLFRMAGSR